MSQNCFNDPESDEIDNLIFSNRKLEAVRLIRKLRNVDLAGAIELLNSRYRELRAARPERFTCSDAEYWQGSYS